jgi:hypothetical protein
VVSTGSLDGDYLWSNPANWSFHTMPANGSIVVIDGNGVDDLGFLSLSSVTETGANLFYIAGSSRAIGTLDTRPAFELYAGILGVTTPVTGSLSLSSVTETGDNLFYIAGSSLTIGTLAVNANGELYAGILGAPRRSPSLSAVSLAAAAFWARSRDLHRPLKQRSGRALFRRLCRIGHAECVTRRKLDPGIRPRLCRHHRVGNPTHRHPGRDTRGPRRRSTSAGASFGGMKAAPKAATAAGARWPMTRTNFSWQSGARNRAMCSCVAASSSGAWSGRGTGLAL